MKNKKLFIFILLGAALIGVALWKFVGFNAPPEEKLPPPAKIQAPSEEPAVTPPTTSPPTLEIKKAVQKFVIEGDEFSFSPQNIAISRGETVELTFKNVGRIPHNYVIDELSITTKTIGGGKTDVVTFVSPDTSGAITYASYCSLPGHREAGMVGTIEIK